MKSNSTINTSSSISNSSNTNKYTGLIVPVDSEEHASSIIKSLRKSTESNKRYQRLSNDQYDDNAFSTISDGRIINSLAHFNAIVSSKPVSDTERVAQLKQPLPPHIEMAQSSPKYRIKAPVTINGGRAVQSSGDMNLKQEHGSPVSPRFETNNISTRGGDAYDSSSDDDDYINSNHDTKRSSNTHYDNNRKDVNSFVISQGIPSSNISDKYQIKSKGVRDSLVRQHQQSDDELDDFDMDDNMELMKGFTAPVITVNGSASSSSSHSTKKYGSSNNYNNDDEYDDDDSYLNSDAGTTADSYIHHKQRRNNGDKSKVNYNHHQQQHSVSSTENTSIYTIKTGVQGIKQLSSKSQYSSSIISGGGGSSSNSNNRILSIKPGQTIRVRPGGKKLKNLDM